MAEGTSCSHFVMVGNDKEYGGDAGWVEARRFCDHLKTLSSDLLHIPPPQSSCSRCENPSENWLCLGCKGVFCSRFLNKHMLEHFQNTSHCLALSYSDLSVWCYLCDAYLDAHFILELRPVYETVYLLKFNERPPVQAMGFELGAADSDAQKSCNDKGSGPSNSTC
ncbi:Histone deacetylase 6 [Nymphaea thermarum]|nr:Histone deacetylase 6 [Nymphaea thermarum]